MLAQADGLSGLVTGAVVVSAGLGPMMALATDMVVGSAPPSRAGAAAAISSTAPQLGGALGIALLGSLITAVASTYEENASADAAYAAGFHVAVLVSAVLMVLTAVLVLLRTGVDRNRP